jgi:RND family efflux transporter MFP subunit
VTPFRLKALLVASVAITGCQPPEPPAAPPPPEVTVAIPVQRDVVAYAEFTGRTEAIESVEIRARVPGVLQRMAFEPSTFVRKGQLLFVIEQEPYIARRDQADADVKTWEAERDRARSDLERLELAIRTNAVSQQEVDRARADLKQAEANLLGSRARLEQAKIDFGYTEVRSPIAGLVGRRLVDMGNLVGSGENTLLTTVVKLEPIFAYFDVSERILLQIIEARGMNLREVQTAAPEERPQVFLGLANEDGWPHEGRID